MIKILEIILFFLSYNTHIFFVLLLLICLNIYLIFVYITVGLIWVVQIHYNLGESL